MDTWHQVQAPTGSCCSTACASLAASSTRTRGLLGRRSLPQGEGLAFREKSIHMFFMRMSLDIVFCDAELQIVRIVARAPPWRMAGCRRARYALEIGPGEAARLGLQRRHGAAGRARLLSARADSAERAPPMTRA